MKFKITLKDPDGFIDSIEEAVDLIEVVGLQGDALEAVKQVRKDEIMEVCSDWFEYSEYLTVEVDTDLRTCTVVPKS